MIDIAGFYAFTLLEVVYLINYVIKYGISRGRRES